MSTPSPLDGTPLHVVTRHTGGFLYAGGPVGACSGQLHTNYSFIIYTTFSLSLSVVQCSDLTRHKRNLSRCAIVQSPADLSELRPSGPALSAAQPLPLLLLASLRPHRQSTISTFGRVAPSNQSERYPQAGAGALLPAKSLTLISLVAPSFNHLQVSPSSGRALSAAQSPPCCSRWRQIHGTSRSSRGFANSFGAF